MLRLVAALLCCATLSVAVPPDYYDVLSVTRMTDAEGVKASFKRLAKQWHPDRNPDNRDEATAMMKLINEAKDTLSDPDRREQYDRMMQRMNSVNMLAHIELPGVVLVYFTCPVYLSFGLNTFLASFLCTAMLMSHLPILLGCYLFYKYAMWGPVPMKDRPFMTALSNVTSLVMLFTLMNLSVVLMISLNEYIPWLIMWVVAPCAALHTIDITLCVETKRERKFTGPAGSPRMVETVLHTRPDYLPFYLSLKDLTEFVSGKIEELDHHPVVTYEFTRTQEVETQKRRCDVEEEELKVQGAKDAQKARKEAAASKRSQQESERQAQLAAMNPDSPKAASAQALQGNGTNGRASPQADAAKPTAAKAKKGENPNVTSTGNSAWSLEQQQAFEKALKKYPSGTANRWESVAETVPEKTAKQCADRFKELASLRSTLGTKKA